MDFKSTFLIDIDVVSLNQIQEQLSINYGLVVRPTSNIDRSFERAMSICLFENEQEVNSISQTLTSQYDW